MNDLLNALLLHGRHARDAGDDTLARTCFEQARQLAPDQPDVSLDLAATCLACGDATEALRHAEDAQRGHPDWRADFISAQAYKRLGQPDDQNARLKAALADARLPDKVRVVALSELADLQLNAFGDAGAAAVSLRTAAEVQPERTLEARLAALVADLYEGRRSGAETARGFGALAPLLDVPPAPAAKPPRPPGARLRIGLVSSQFCASPVGFLTLGALTELARSADLFFFDRGAKPDWAQAAFRGIAHRWLTCPGIDSATLHRLMCAADLDTLIDLGGWTDPAALAAVAGRPARRQLKWVGGQAVTTGLHCFDGFVTDMRQTPAAASALYTEPLLLARHGYVTYFPPPYAPGLSQRAAYPPKARRPDPGVLALVANPAKISTATADAIRQWKPRKLLLIDQRWRHHGTRLAARQRLGDLLDMAEFITPASHPEYLQVLQETDTHFHDTTPYSMGLTAVELRLFGKHIVAPARAADAVMSERHCVAHKGGRRFDHHESLAGQLLEWSRG